MTPEVALFGRKAFALCGMASRFTRSLMPRIEAATEIPAGSPESVMAHLSTFRGYYSRTATWLASVEKMTASTDLQAVSVAARSLFEILVDLVLLHHAPAEFPVERVFGWERSAVMKQAERVARYYKGRPVPAPYAGWLTLLSGSEPARIRANRAAWWSGEHPARWTGLGRGLEADAKRADELRPELGLLEFYEMNYAMLCWVSHGSGLASLRTGNPEIIPTTCAVRLVMVHNLGVQAAQLVMEELGQYQSTEFDSYQAEVTRLIDGMSIEPSSPSLEPRIAEPA
ncbi:MAG: hypothetical protein KGL39_45425 [Patescibacteria group bacterium]|nr:hypothetical protein [Patescibacteria group bacterium]